MDQGTQSLSGRIAEILNPAIFYLLLVIVALAAIPYGSAEPWWRALCECLIFVLTMLWAVEGFLVGRWFVRQHRILTPLLALLAFMLVQMKLPLRHVAAIGEVGGTWMPISFSTYNTRLVAQLLLALICSMALLIRYTDSRRRLTMLAYVVIGIGLTSTVFGLVRKALQTAQGFVLPALPPDDGTVLRGVGFAQFINHNHFAFLAEMSLGLVLGLMLARPIRFTRLALGLALAIPMWIAIVYSNSRAGLGSMVGQVLFVTFAVFIAGPSRELFSERGRQTQPRRLAPFLLTRAILVVSFLVVMVVGIGWVGGERLATHLDSASSEVGIPESDKYTRTYRSTIWPMTWQMFKDHPLAGTGFGAYWIAITKCHHGSGDMTPQEAHNDYLEFLASGGLIAVVVLIGFVVLCARELTSAFRQSDAGLRALRLGALAGIFAVAIHSVVDFGLHIVINSLVFMILIVIASVKIERPATPQRT